jgi:hypothetical protein
MMKLSLLNSVGDHRPEKFSGSRPINFSVNLPEYAVWMRKQSKIFDRVATQKLSRLDLFLGRDPYSVVTLKKVWVATSDGSRSPTRNLKKI